MRNLDYLEGTRADCYEEGYEDGYRAGLDEDNFSKVFIIQGHGEVEGNCGYEQLVSWMYGAFREESIAKETLEKLNIFAKQDMVEDLKNLDENVDRVYGVYYILSEIEVE